VRRPRAFYDGRLMTSCDTPSIEHFVRVNLGCNCPDEVFRSIAIDRAPMSGPASECARLVIGDRLLIYVLERAAESELTESVARLATAGLAERNARGLNRFRLVVATPRPVPHPEEAQARFAQVAGSDDRAHLHLVAADMLPESLRPHCAG
jgi:hypothetical protein